MLEDALSKLRPQMVTEYRLYEYLQKRLDRQVTSIKERKKKGK